jgi:hypothetical protein
MAQVKTAKTNAQMTGRRATVSPLLWELAEGNPSLALKKLESSREGLTDTEVVRRQRIYGKTSSLVGAVYQGFLEPVHSGVIGFGGRFVRYGCVPGRRTAGRRLEKGDHSCCDDSGQWRDSVLAGISLYKGNGEIEGDSANHSYRESHSNEPRPDGTGYAIENSGDGFR